jgi:hypothetical protein
MVILGRAGAMLAIAWLVLLSYRYIASNSRVMGKIALAGILLRVVIGLALFWISYLQLPIAASLQAGDGFWQPAPDARSYYELATSTISGTRGEHDAIPSPLFVNVLAVWMSIVGISPASAFVLNLGLYVALIALVVWYYRPVNEWRRDLPCLIGVAAYSFSPALLLHGSQPLKDAMSCTFIGAACLGVLGLRGLIYRRPDKRTNRSVWIATGVLSVAIFGMAGVRWYYAVMMVCALAATLAVFAFRGRTTPLRPYLGGSALVLAALTIAFVTGAEPEVRRIVRTEIVGGARVDHAIDTARSGFIRTGGVTNFGDLGPRHALLGGAAFMLVPMSIIDAVTGIRIQGGKGLLLIVDADTFFQDLAIIAIAVLLWRRRRAVGTRLPFIVFGLVLAVTTTMLIGYIVTNIGTQWRLRLLATVPLWFLGMGVSPRLSHPAPSPVASSQSTAVVRTRAARRRSHLIDLSIRSSHAFQRMMAGCVLLLAFRKLEAVAWIAQQRRGGGNQ